MDNNSKNQKENRSMYLYTALIFVVALLLILIAFFSQTNIYKLGNRANEFATATPIAEQSPAPDQNGEFAKIANMAAELDTENKELKQKISIYDNILAANAYLSVDNIAEAETIINTIDDNTLSENQKILYEQIKTKINEGKEQ